MAQLFVTRETPRARVHRRLLLAQATKMQVDLPKSLPTRSDANDPTKSLSWVLSLAQKNNIDLLILRQRVVQAELARAKSWSILKPQLQLQASYTRLDSETSISGTVITPQNSLAVQLQLQWAFLNLSAIPLIQTAYLAVDQINHTAKQLKREVLFGVVRGYYGVLLADGLIRIAEQTWTNAKEHLRIAEARLQAGVTPELAVTRAQLDLAQAWRNWIQADNGLRNARLALALLLNRSDFPMRPVRPGAPSLPMGNITTWRREAMGRREEVKAARIAVEIAEKNVTREWMQFLPTFAATGAVQGSNAGGFTDRYVQWSVTFAAQLKLYGGGTRYLQVKEAYSKLTQARLEQIKAVRQVDNEVAQAAVSLSNAKVTWDLAKKQLILAERSFQLTEDRYKTGVATPVEVSDALTALQSARISLLREELNYEVAILTLQRALGLFKP